MLRFMRYAFATLLVLAVPATLSSQSPTPSRTPRAGSLRPNALSLSARPTPAPFGTDSSSLNSRLGLSRALEQGRAGKVVLGGLIGGAAGIVVCTAISNLVKDSGTGFSTCTTSGYLGFALGGAAVGATVGALIK